MTDACKKIDDDNKFEILFIYFSSSSSKRLDMNSLGFLVITTHGHRLDDISSFSYPSFLSLQEKRREKESRPGHEWITKDFLLKASRSVSHLFFFLYTKRKDKERETKLVTVRKSLHRSCWTELTCQGILLP